METIDELSQKLKLTPDQKSSIEIYIKAIVIELLESIKQDNIKNFDETIAALNQKKDTEN
ncbi:MAG TPA: hypothetical protein VF828_03155 [Patescibacteria group bacterium]